MRQNRVNGSLVVVGIGIKIGEHLTLEAYHAIADADKVFFLAGARAAKEWFLSLSPGAVDLSQQYAVGDRRLDSYQQMVAQILEPLAEGQRVCAAFYGHPGVFVWPSHEVVRQARQLGHWAQMLPGVSAEDCLFADLGFDPAQLGCQTYEATDFLIRPRQFDVHSGLILWQIGVIGNLTAAVHTKALTGLQLLSQKLCEQYGEQHEVYVYEAATSRDEASRVQQVTLAALPQAAVTQLSTLYVPPLALPAVDYDMMALLNLTVEQLTK